MEVPSCRVTRVLKERTMVCNVGQDCAQQRLSFFCTYRNEIYPVLAVIVILQPHMLALGEILSIIHMQSALPGFPGDEVFLP